MVQHQNGAWRAHQIGAWGIAPIWCGTRTVQHQNGALALALVVGGR